MTDVVNSETRSYIMSQIKAGIINFSRYLASYYGKYDIRVNCICPGGIFDSQPKDFLKNYHKKVPFQCHKLDNQFH